MDLPFTIHPYKRAEKINESLQLQKVAILFDDIWKDEEVTRIFSLKGLDGLIL